MLFTKEFIYSVKIKLSSKTGFEVKIVVAPKRFFSSDKNENFEEQKGNVTNND